MILTCTGKFTLYSNVKSFEMFQTYIEIWLKRIFMLYFWSNKFLAAYRTWCDFYTRFYSQPLIWWFIDPVNIESKLVQFQFPRVNTFQSDFNSEEFALIQYFPLTRHPKCSRHITMKTQNYGVVVQYCRYITPKYPWLNSYWIPCLLVDRKSLKYL